VPEAILDDAVDARRMMADLGQFARRAKLSGTPEELESFQYLKTRIESCGYWTSALREANAAFDVALAA
jgi:hypothetical protein